MGVGCVKIVHFKRSIRMSEAGKPEEYVRAVAPEETKVETFEKRNQPSEEKDIIPRRQ